MILTKHLEVVFFQILVVRIVLRPAWEKFPTEYCCTQPVSGHSGYQCKKSTSEWVRRHTRTVFFPFVFRLFLMITLQLLTLQHPPANTVHCKTNTSKTQFARTNPTSICSPTHVDIEDQQLSQIQPARDFGTKSQASFKKRDTQNKMNFHSVDRLAKIKLQKTFPPPILPPLPCMNCCLYFERLFA